METPPAIEVEWKALDEWKSSEALLWMIFQKVTRWCISTTNHQSRHHFHHLVLIFSKACHMGWLASIMENKESQNGCVVVDPAFILNHIMLLYIPQTDFYRILYVFLLRSSCGLFFLRVRDKSSACAVLILTHLQAPGSVNSKSTFGLSSNSRCDTCTTWYCTRTLYGTCTEVNLCGNHSTMQIGIDHNHPRSLFLTWAITK